MPVSLTATCPTCNANIADDDRTCGRCGALVAAFPVVERTPLILPGNPALSADLVRARVRPVRVIAGAVLGSLALLTVLWVRSQDEPEPEVAPLARGIEQASDSVTGAASAPQTSLPAGDASSTVAVVPATTPTVAPLPPIPTPEQAAATAAAAPTRDPVVAQAVTPPPAQTPASVATASAAPTARIPAPVTAAPTARTSVATAARATPPVAATASPTVAAGSPVLRLASLVSDSLRPGELLQLRWTIQDRTTGRTMPMPLEFTSADASIAQVDRRTGVVSARAPGRVRIIADAGVAGTASIDIWVRAASRTATVAASTADSLQLRVDAARSVSTLAAAPSVRASVLNAPPAAASRAVPSGDLLDAEDVRGAVDRFVSQVRANSVKNFELLSFFNDGAGHRVALMGAPATIGAGGNIVRVSFDVRLSKYDAGGRPVTRVAPVSMDVEKRGGDVTSSAVAISALRKP